MLYFVDCLFYLFLKDFIYLFLERGDEWEKDRERNVNMSEICESVASPMAPAGDLACHPGLCLDWELNWQPFGSQVSTQSTEPYQQGYPCVFLNLGKNLQSLSLSVTLVVGLS